MLHVGDGLSDRDVFDSRKTDDVSGERVVDVDAPEPLEGEELRDFRVVERSIELANGDRVADFHPSVEDPADRNPAQVVAGIEVRHEHLERRLTITARRRHRIDDGVEQRTEVRSLLRGFQAGRARPRARVQDRKIELFLRGVEVDEEVVDLVEDLLWTRVRPIDLVDHDDRGQSPFQGLAQDEPGLWQRPFRGVHEQQHAVDHGQRPFDLSAEIGVTRRVDDVDEGVAVVDGGVLREDGDAALALQIRVVHRTLRDPLVRAEDAALVEHGVDERRLAVVDVRDDRDVAAERVGDGMSGFLVRRHPTSIPSIGETLRRNPYRRRGGGRNTQEDLFVGKIPSSLPPVEVFSTPAKRSPCDS